MALFDFLKPKQATVTNVKPAPTNRQECDISKTNIIIELFKIPRDKRDTNWHQTFYQNVATARRRH